MKTILTRYSTKQRFGLFIFLGFLFITTTSTVGVNNKLDGINSTSVKLKQGKSVELGTYLIYSGIPSTYIGKLVIMKDNLYKVSVIPNDDLYDTGGMFVYESETNTIVWKTGLCKINNWNGNIDNTTKGKDRIVFNKATYAEFSHK